MALQATNVFGPEQSHLDELLASYLAAQKRGEAPDRQQLLNSHPELAEELQAFFADQDEFNRLAAPLRNLMPATSPSMAKGQQIGNYEVYEEIACGGMGVVYKALQKNLNRIVALKMLRAGRLATAADRQRFWTEVEAVATLDHPHIVPIFEVGEHNDQPYFSMKLIEGGSLAQAIGSGQWHVGNDEANRGVANLGAKVAAAVHFAHQRGILHRDLKPANILLDSAGEPFVTDFGLAKRVSRSEIGQANPSTQRRDHDLTQTGSVLGTPSYMAPEQATGKRNLITTAADVYSLGAILYELLTGRPPFRADTPLETLRLLLEEEALPPRSLNRRVHRDLETICLKCLEKDPRKRYASAQALEEDLERFLGNEPILARPVGTVERIRRWCGRKPIVAGLLLALSLAVTGGFGLVTWQWRRAERLGDIARANFLDAADHRARAEANLAEVRRQEALAKQNLDEADRQRAHAEESFKLAHQAVNNFCMRVEQELSNVPGVQPLRKELLTAALDYYQSFIKQRANDPRIKAEQAETSFRVASITSIIGSKPQALKAYRQAQEIYLDLLRDNPTHAYHQSRLAHTYNNVGTLHVATGQIGAALVSLQQARDLWEQIVKATPHSTQFQADLATTYSNLGGVYGEFGRLAEAQVALEKSRDIREMLTRSNPDIPHFQNDLARSYGNLSILYNKIGRPDDAAEALLHARDLREEIARAHPNNALFQAELAGSYRQVGNSQRFKNKYREALDSLQKGQHILENLLQVNPAVTLYQSELALCLSDIGAVLHATGRDNDALKSYQRALDIHEKLAQANPAVLSFQRELGKDYFNVGNCHSSNGHKVEAILTYQRAREVEEKIVLANPDNADCRSELAITLNNLGLVLRDRDRIDEAVATLRQAIEHHRVALAKMPREFLFRKRLSNHYAALAEIFRQKGRPGEAFAANIERCRLWSANGEELYQGAREFALQAAAVSDDLSGEEQPAARQCADQGMITLRQALAQGLNKLERLHKDPALDPLRQRHDFKEMMQQIDKSPAHNP